jgi:hypothetical protein
MSPLAPANISLVDDRYDRYDRYDRLTDAGTGPMTKAGQPDFTRARDYFLITA